MEPLYIITIGVMAGVSAYLLMSRNVLRMVLGLLLLGNAANLTIFVAGRLGSSLPPLVAEDQVTVAVSANPLPQALILTAIVISFSLVAFTVVLLHRAYQRLHLVDTEKMREAEPVEPDPAPAALSEDGR